MKWCARSWAGANAVGHDLDALLRLSHAQPGRTSVGGAGTVRLRQLKRPTLGATLDFGFDGIWYEKSFVRGEASFVQPVGYTLGDVFGNQNRNPAQVRGLIETGLLF